MANKKIKIPITESDLNDLFNGEIFNWTFEGVDCQLFMGCDGCQKPVDDCVCAVEDEE